MTEDDERAAWAEQLDSFGPDARHYSGAESQAKTRAELEAALGGAGELERALRGRPPLNSSDHMWGDQAPKVTVRLSPQLDRALVALAASQNRKRSDVLRDALGEYAARHTA
jgi:hypothetical protein